MKHIHQVSVMKAQALPTECTDLPSELTIDGLKACINALLDKGGDGQ